MAIYQRLLLAAIAFLALHGCGSSSEQTAPAEPPPVKDTAFGDMVGTMDKARGVQNTVDAQKQDLDRQLQSAEGEQ
jgi:nitrous oxide reductase accessory protein NosL